MGFGLFCSSMSRGLSCIQDFICGVVYCRNSARFLWKSIPSTIKENEPELVAAWKTDQKLWTREYGAVHEAIHGFDWSQEIQGLVAAFSGKYFKLHFTK
jgi:COP9 signalosome complex subunit 8